MQPIIEVKNISKRYEINHLRGSYVALRDILGDNLRHPLKLFAGKTIVEDYWALKDVSFNVAAGEAIGVIGPNGAGKSTLLKILTKITPPTNGEIILRGKVSSLLEVGTGFHPELTGRENIYLNGAILGMSQREIKKKFDAIVDFSGVEKFLDTPVKRYSSGMYVRLAFSVAAHLEPDILLVDEVLAVGDTAFQKKCLGKMDEVTRTQGRTVIFVSHNMGAIQSLCSRCIYLNEGKVEMVGPTIEVIAKYLNTSSKGFLLENRKDRKGVGEAKITSFFVEKNGENVPFLNSGEKYTFCLGYKSKKGKPLKNVAFSIGIFSENGVQLTNLITRYTKQNFLKLPPDGVIRCQINQRLPLSPGIYQISAMMVYDGGTDAIKNAGLLEVREGDFYKSGVTEIHGPLFLEQNWSVG